MDTKIINAENAPAAVGPYCHAVEAGDFVFTSGQIGLDPQTQELKEGVAAQTKQVRLKMNLKNMKEKVASDEALNKKVENIITAPSLGFTSVITVIAETNGFALIQNRKQLTSYAGFDVKDNQSGNVEGTSRISKKGNSRIRAILYMPAVQAQLRSKHLKEAYDRIVQKHPDKKMIAVTAIERRLLLLIYALWKSDKPYDEDHNKKK